MGKEGNMGEEAIRGVRSSFFGRIPEEVLAAKNALRDRLFGATEAAIPQALALRKAKGFQPAIGVNLVGVGVGEKLSAGKQTGEMCVKVFVAKKYPKGKVPSGDLVPAKIDEIPTDIEGVGYVRKFQIPQRKRHRPVPGGVSVGLPLSVLEFRFGGTLGVVVVDSKDPSHILGLSNNHVLADENRVSLGAAVVQPATLDGGGEADRIGHLARTVPLKFNNKRNWMDAAAAEFENPETAERNLLGIGRPTGSANPSLGLLVRKSGRTTGLTEGVVREMNFDVFNIGYEQGMVRVDDVIVIRGTSGSFSKPGDSGSAIVDPQGRAVALLFAGSEIVTFAIPIRRILRRLKLRIAT
jgi:hypothetical protein